MKSYILTEKLTKKESITIQFVGDSVTEGTNHCRAEETYTAKFAELVARDFREYSVYRYDGIVSDEKSPIRGFDGPVLVSYRENAPMLDIIKNGVGGNTAERAYRRKENFIGILPNGKKLMSLSLCSV